MVTLYEDRQPQVYRFDLPQHVFGPMGERQNKGHAANDAGGAQSDIDDHDLLRGSTPINDPLSVGFHQATDLSADFFDEFNNTTI